MNINVAWTKSVCVYEHVCVCQCVCVCVCIFVCISFRSLLLLLLLLMRYMDLTLQITEFKLKIEWKWFEMKNSLGIIFITLYGLIYRIGMYAVSFEWNIKFVSDSLHGLFGLKPFFIFIYIWRKKKSHTHAYIFVRILYSNEKNANPIKPMQKKCFNF